MHSRAEKHRNYALLMEQTGINPHMIYHMILQQVTLKLPLM